LEPAVDQMRALARRVCEESCRTETRYHLQWTICISALKGFAFPANSLDCEDAWPYMVYSTAILACFIAATILEVLLVISGSQGEVLHLQSQ
jgi:hypothetical protein